MKESIGMLKIDNFKRYLAAGNSRKYGYLLNEGLTDIQQLVFPNISISDAINFLRLIPGWKNSNIDSEISLNFKSEKEFSDFQTKIEKYIQDYPYNTKLMRGFHTDEIKKSGGLSYEFNIKAPDGLESALHERYCEQVFSMFKSFMAQNKLGPLLRLIQLHGNKIIVKPGTDEETKKAWNALTVFITNEDIVKDISSAVAIGSKLKNDPKKAKQEMSPFIQDIRKVSAGIKIPDMVSDDTIAQMNKSLAKSEENIQVRFTGNYNACAFIYFVYATDHTVKFTQLYGYLSLDNLLKNGLLIDAFSDTQMSKDIKKSCASKITIIGNISKLQRQLLKEFNELCTPRDEAWKTGIDKQISILQQKLTAPDQDQTVKSELNSQIDKLKLEKTKKQRQPREVIEFMHANNIGLKITNYLKIRANDIEDIKVGILKKLGNKPDNVSDKDWNDRIKQEFDKEIKNIKHIDIDAFSNIDDMFTAVTETTKPLFDIKIDTSEQEKQRKKQQLIDYKPEFTNKVAKRRWKLFEAFKRTDNGEVYSNKDWTMSVCRTDDQLAIFSRNKPKVDAKGNIIAEANLEDWENITPSMKKIRDGNGDWIQDGLGRHLDEHETETIWCIAGSYCNKTTRDRQKPFPWYHKNARIGSYTVNDSKRGTILLQFMDNNTGMLFMLGDQYILDENDDYNGAICGTGGIETLKKQCIRLHSFGQLIHDSGIYESLVTHNTKERSKTEQEILNDAITEGVVTADGEMTVSSEEMLTKYKSVVTKVERINVMIPDASYLFSNIFNGQNVNLPIINCRKVINAEGMFRGIHSPVIRLEDTDSIQHMSYMFSEVWTGQITGLDTSSACTINNIFDRCQQKVFQLITIPALNLKKCTNIESAFKNSYIAEVNLLNTDKVMRATDAFVGMPFLHQVPNVMFKSIINPAHLRNSFNGDYTTIFDGCDLLLGGSKFDAKVEEIEQYYQHPDKNRKSDFADDRNFIIINSSDDVAKFESIMYKYPGVVIAKDASIYRIFYRRMNLKIRVLDINGHKDISNMFYGCTGFSIGKIIGTENVEKADSLFKGSKCNICPHLELPKLTGEIRVFNGMHPFGNNAKAGLLKCGKYVEEFDLSDNANERIEEITYGLFGDTASEWQNSTVIQNVIVSFYDNNIDSKNKLLEEQYKPDENGVVTVDYQDIMMNLQLILKAKPKTLKFSDLFVEQLNNGLFNDNNQRLWSKTNSKNISLPDIDLNGTTNGNNLFREARFIDNGKIIGLENIKTAKCMFAHMDIHNLFNIDSPIVFSNLKEADGMFINARTVIKITKMEFPVLERAVKMFQNAQIFEDSLEKIEYKNLKYAGEMFSSQHNGNLAYIGEINLPEAIDCASMFFNRIISSVGTVNIPKCINTIYMFNSCNDLTRIGSLNMPSAQVCDYMFQGCSRLKVIGAFNTGTVLNKAQGIFGNPSPLSVIFGVDGSVMFARSRIING